MGDRPQAAPAAWLGNDNDWGFWRGRPALYGAHDAVGEVASICGKTCD